MEYMFVPKLRRNGAFQKNGHRNFVRAIEYRAFQKLAICGWCQKTQN